MGSNPTLFIFLLLFFFYLFIFCFLSFLFFTCRYLYGRAQSLRLWWQPIHVCVAGIVRYKPLFLCYQTPRRLMSGVSGNSILLLHKSIGDALKWHFYRGPWVTERAVMGKLPRETLFIEQLGILSQGCTRGIKWGRTKKKHRPKTRTERCVSCHTVGFVLAFILREARTKLQLQSSLDPSLCLAPL